MVVGSGIGKGEPTLECRNQVEFKGKSFPFDWGWGHAEQSNCFLDLRPMVIADEFRSKLYEKDERKRELGLRMYKPQIRGPGKKPCHAVPCRDCRGSVGVSQRCTRGLSATMQLINQRIGDPKVVGTLPKLECGAWEPVTDILSGFNPLFIPYFLLRELWEIFSGPVLLLESNEYVQSIRELPINAKLQDTQEVGRRISKRNEATEPTRSYTPLHGSRHCTPLHATARHASARHRAPVPCRAVQCRAAPCSAVLVHNDPYSHSTSRRVLNIVPPTKAEVLSTELSKLRPTLPVPKARPENTKNCPTSGILVVSPFEEISIATKKLNSDGRRSMFYRTLRRQRPHFLRVQHILLGHPSHSPGPFSVSTILSSENVPPASFVLEKPSSHATASDSMAPSNSLEVLRTPGGGGGGVEPAPNRSSMPV
ncbi:hypothetical protein B0H16DRAFT_1707859 [Mycena metata]|uniref:Uncharacterized protein n=1 Tax=Mycena metata TaxID=1033252 RepID=A0AAD7DCU1_9AGAR|nr:hypothetical protein B0H16DRAFT_1707859 [Mycena metata]